MKCLRYAIIIGVCLWTGAAAAQSKAPARNQAKRSAAPPRAPALQGGNVGGALAGEGGERALEIKGQTRNVSSMLVRQSGKDSIDFVKLRKDYKREILGTKY